VHTIFDIARGAVDDLAPSRLEERVATEGLRGRWYALTGSHNVGGTPVRVERMGEPIVLWRDTGGALHAQEDRCPHRGARLSQGRVVDDTIACPYHGIMLDGSGRIAKVPALPGCPIEGRLALRTYATQERGGAIFGYFPTPANEQPPPFEGPPELSDPAWSYFPLETTWNVNWRYAMENTVDPMHGPYLHGNSHSMSVGKKDDVLQVDETPRGFRVWRTLQKDVALDAVEFNDTSFMWVCLDTPYAPQVGPGGPFRILGFATPIDERNCIVFFWRLRRVDGWQRDLWRFLYMNRLGARHWAVLEQDRVMLEGLPDDANARETLYQHDIGVTRMRRHLKALARAQIDAARELAAQPAVRESILA
jgi:phenylpropionate dioxygenase-like ring-hydroxylating dioxygenase large terminal subunit